MRCRRSKPIGPSKRQRPGGVSDEIISFLHPRGSDSIVRSVSWLPDHYSALAFQLMPWRIEGSFPGHSCGTAPDLHRCSRSDAGDPIGVSALAAINDNTSANADAHSASSPLKMLADDQAARELTR